MNSINLIPAAIRHARRTRTRLHGWGAGLVLWCGILALAGLLMVREGDRGSSLAARERVQRLTDSVDAAVKELAAADAELARLERLAETQSLVTDHPDWSRLTVLIAMVRGPSVAVEMCEVARMHARPQAVAKPARPASAPGAAPPPLTPAQRAEQAQLPPGEAYIVRINGLAQSVREAQAFVVRLEEQGVFDSVSLIETRPQQTRGIDTTWFRVECRLADQKSSPATPKAPDASKEAAQ